MKKLYIILLLLCFVFLTACISEKQVSGEIIERSLDEDVGIVSFVIQTDAGEKVGILMTDETWVLPLSGIVTDDDFRFKEQDGIIVSISYEGSARSLTTKSGEVINAYNAKSVNISEIKMQDTFTLSDNTSVYLWDGGDSTYYKLNDGTKLLWEQKAHGPDNTYVMGIESYDDLSETAKSKVLAYYEEQGLLYNVQDELERAYAAYLSCEDKAEFKAYVVGQEVAPTASNSRVMYFLTSVTLPIDGDNCTELRVGAAFNRETGEQINAWDLFSCDEHEVKQTMLDIADITDPALRAEIETAFRPEYLLVFPDNLEVCFPQGSLPSQKFSYALGLDYDARLSKILYDWAIPKNTE